MKTGIYGGSFDPPHKIHREMCRSAAKEYGLDRIIVLPTATPPHKEVSGTSAKHRFEMAKITFKDELFTVSDLEQKEGISYTYQTLEEMKKLYPQDELFLIIGGDSMDEMHTWKNPDIITKLAKLIVIPRIPMISSTNARSLLEFGILPDIDLAVLEYININNLYGKYRRLTKKLQTYIDGGKYLHSAYTAAMGDKISRGLNLSPVDRERVYIACILHDCAKQMSTEDAAKYGFEKYNKSMHGFLGEAVAKKDFGITDPLILEAIRYHTTAAPDMGRLAKILYVADACEETREQDTQEFIGGLSAQNFEERFKLLLKARYELLIKTKKPEEINPLTKAACEFYLKDWQA